MSARQPATDKGTADRIEADDGGYWVRLVTKQALRREGECMDNCLARGDYDDKVGDEEMVSRSLWSLRSAGGLSYLLAEVDVAWDQSSVSVDEAKGPKNSQPSGWCVRQLRHLVAAFRAAGADLRVPEAIALTGADGRTWRPDKAPQDVRDAIATRIGLEQAEAMEAARARGDLDYFVRNDPFVRLSVENMCRNIVGTGTIPSSRFPEEWLSSHFGTSWEDHAAPPPESTDDAVIYRARPDEPFQVMRGQDRQAAISAAMQRGIIHRYDIEQVGGDPAVETVTVRPRLGPDRFSTRNEDGTWKLSLGDIVFPKVMPTDNADAFGEVGVVKFRIAPSIREPAVLPIYLSTQEARGVPGETYEELVRNRALRRMHESAQRTWEWAAVHGLQGQIVGRGERR